MEKLRSQIDDKYKWDLSTIYKDDEELQADYVVIKKRLDNFAKQEDTFLNSADHLYNTLKEYYDISVIIDKMWTYTSHRYDTDITNNKNQAWSEKINNLFTELDKQSSFITPKLLEMSDKTVDKFYQDKPELKEDYGFVLELIFRNKPYTLTLSEEKLLSSALKAMGDTSKIATMLTTSDINFGEIEDAGHHKITLTDTNYFSFISSHNREVRKSAFESLYKSYKQFNNTYALSLSAFIEKMVTISKIRHYNSALEAALFADNVSTDVYSNLINIVNNNLEPLYKYYEIKRKFLKLDEFHMYDVYAQIVGENQKKYSFEEAKKLILEGLKILGDDYVNNLQKAFEERWIDIYPNKAKRGGAYSGGSYLTNPFVFLNFNGSYNDVSTMAHELGHSMHTYYSHMNNKYQYSDYTIFVAEVASQVNELLFSNYMLNKVQTKEEKLNILNQILDLFKSSIYRQTMFAEFEKIIYEKNEQEEIITADILNETYYNLVSKYFGPKVVIDEEIRYEWQRIPHFYYNFYVYKYSTGLAAACHIVNRILSNEKGALEEYLTFLKTGGNDYPLNELKIAGVDLSKPQVIQSAMDMFSQYLAQFEKLLDS